MESILGLVLTSQFIQVLLVKFIQPFDLRPSTFDLRPSTVGLYLFICTVHTVKLGYFRTMGYRCSAIGLEPWLYNLEVPLFGHRPRALLRNDRKPLSLSPSSRWNAPPPT